MIHLHYSVKEEKPEAKCTNCINRPYCALSLQMEKFKKYFDVDADKCNQYHYTPPIAEFRSDDEELTDKIVKIIEEYEAKSPISEHIR